MDALDPVFNALADATRRAILVRLAQSEATVGTLREPFSISAPAISRHLKVLEEAALITNERRGKERVCRLRPDTLARAREWLDFSRRFWQASFDRLDQHLKETKKAARVR
jgi:DNA-binding transcriptional ArsR family regulator